MNREALIQSARTIAEYCRNHICTECPLNIGKKNDGILHAHCVCVIHLPSTWKIEELKNE